MMRPILAIAGWVLLVAIILLTALLAGWVLLGALLLYGDQLLGVAALALLMAAIAGIAWLTAKFFTSPRVVAAVIGAMSVALLTDEVTWAQLTHGPVSSRV